MRNRQPVNVFHDPRCFPREEPIVDLMKGHSRRSPLSYQRFAIIVKMFCHGFRIDFFFFVIVLHKVDLNINFLNKRETEGLC